jgi:FkbM family methyltransferase
MPLRHRLIRLFPPRYELPLRYAYRRFRRKLDRESTAFLAYVRPGSTAIDIGARTGVFTYALRRAGADAVIAVDPLPWNGLSAWAAATPRVEVAEVALSDSPGQMTLHIPIVRGQPRTGNASLTAPDGPYETKAVKVVTLDSLARSLARSWAKIPPISAIKLDVEGHEDKVLRGSIETVDRFRPAVLLEIEERHRERPVDDAFAFFLDRGYEGFFFDSDDRMQPVAKFRVEVHQRPFANDPHSPHYANNFLFVSQR